MEFRAREVSGTFEKQAPGLTQLCKGFQMGSLTDGAYILGAYRGHRTECVDIIYYS